MSLLAAEGNKLEPIRNIYSCCEGTLEDSKPKSYLLFYMGVKFGIFHYEKDTN
jgi:hypothetical protein